MGNIKVGVIGAGKMGMLHSCLFNKLQNSELAAICDNTPMNLKLLRSVLPKVRLFEDYSEIIDEGGLDLIVVTTPVFLHKRMALKAMDSGMAVFVEKPLALNAEECYELEQKAGTGPTLVGYCRRFMATYNLAKEYIENETLGRLTSFESHMFVTQVSDDRSSWQYDAKRSGGGVVMDLGSHGVDMLQYLMGEVTDVTGTTEQDLDRGVEDSAKLSFGMRSGQKGNMEVSWTVPGFRLPELLFDMEFERGRIKVCEKYLEITDGTKDLGPRTFFKQMLEKGVQINVAGPEYTREDEHIIEAIKGGGTSRCDFHAAAKTNYIIDAAYRSIKKNGERTSVGWSP